MMDTQEVLTLLSEEAVGLFTRSGGAKRQIQMGDLPVLLASLPFGTPPPDIALQALRTATGAGPTSLGPFTIDAAQLNRFCRMLEPHLRVPASTMLECVTSAAYARLMHALWVLYASSGDGGAGFPGCIDENLLRVLIECLGATPQQVHAARAAGAFNVASTRFSTREYFYPDDVAAVARAAFRGAPPPRGVAEAVEKLRAMPPALVFAVNGAASPTASGPGSGPPRKPHPHILAFVGGAVPQAVVAALPPPAAGTTPGPAPQADATLADLLTLLESHRPASYSLKELSDAVLSGCPPLPPTGTSAAGTGYCSDAWLTVLEQEGAYTQLATQWRRVGAMGSMQAVASALPGSSNAAAATVTSTSSPGPKLFVDEPTIRHVLERLAQAGRCGGTRLVRMALDACMVKALAITGALGTTNLPSAMGGLGTDQKQQFVAKAYTAIQTFLEAASVHRAVFEPYLANQNWSLLEGLRRLHKAAPIRSAGPTRSVSVAESNSPTSVPLNASTAGVESGGAANANGDAMGGSPVARAFLAYLSKTLMASAPRIPPPEPGSAEEEALLHRVFQLCDSRCCQALSPDNAQELLDSLPRVPPNTVVARLFQEAARGSGTTGANSGGANSNDDNDGQSGLGIAQFRAFLTALEKQIRLSTGAMLVLYESACYRKIFELADKDGGGTIDKHEARRLLEAMGATTSEIARVSNTFVDELSFPAFCEIIPSLLKGRSLAQVVESCLHQQRQAQAARRALRMFQQSEEANLSSATGGAAVAAAARALMKKAGITAPTPAPVDLKPVVEEKKMCFSCSELDGTIAAMAEQIEALRQQVRAARDRGPRLVELEEPKPAASKPTPTPAPAAVNEPAAAGSAADANDDDDANVLVGDPFAIMANVAVVPSAPYFRKFPQLSKPLLHAEPASRLASLLDSMRSGNRNVAARAAAYVVEHSPAVLSCLDTLRGDADMISHAVKSILVNALALVDFIEASGEQRDREKLDELQWNVADARTELQTVMGGDFLKWAEQNVVTHVYAATELAVAAAPFTSRASDVLACAMKVDKHMMLLHDMLAYCAVLCSQSQPLDVEIWARRLVANAGRSVPPEQLKQVRATLQTARQRMGSFEAWLHAVDGVRTRFTGLTKALTRSTAMLKDKATLAVPSENWLHVIERHRQKTEEPVAAVASPSQDSPDGTTLYTPRAARVRKLRPEVTDPLRFVDEYICAVSNTRDGLQLPSNFARVDPTVNTFFFGSKIIDILISSDATLVVRVGGGYLLFVEFCQRYCTMEERRLAASTAQQLRRGVSPAVSAAARVMQRTRTPPVGTRSSYL